MHDSRGLQQITGQGPITGGFTSNLAATFNFWNISERLLVRAEDGLQYDVDVIVYATGFDAWTVYIFY